MRRRSGKGKATLLFLAMFGIVGWMASMRAMREREMELQEASQHLSYEDLDGIPVSMPEDERPWSYEEDLEEGVDAILAGEDATVTLEAIEAALDEMGEVDVFEAPGELPGVAARVLTSYENQDAVLVEATYLDLLGNAWGCVILGGGWVDICIVRDGGDGLCRVEVVTLDAETWEEAFN